MVTESSVPPGALAFSRGLYASALDWYKVADSKGQLLLTLNGVYITVRSSLTIASSQNLAKLHTSLPPATWFLLAGAAVATAISILMAVACLYSRLPMRDSMRSGTPSLNEIHRETSLSASRAVLVRHYRPCDP
jgi:EamA domain-containing membrane protein RarD